MVEEGRERKKENGKERKRCLHQVSQRQRLGRNSQAVIFKGVIAGERGRRKQARRGEGTNQAGVPL